MRKYIYSIFLLGLFSCQEEGVVQYTQEKDGLQFSANSSEDMTKVFNFATATYEEEINGEPKTFYYGDSLAAYTFERVVLDLQGFPTPDEREYKLKTVLVEDQDSSKVAEVVFEPYYSLAPNQLKDTIKITVLRPKTRGTYTVGITVDTEGKGAFFDKGVVEKSILRLDIKDVYEQPEGWDERQEWLGEFDEEKYAFMVTVSKQAFSKENNHMWNETDKYNLELREALDEFRMGTEIDTHKLTPESRTSDFDAYCICTGAETPRDLPIPGRELKGIHFALELLSGQNRIIEGETFSKDGQVNAKGRKVLVIGGGDTGSDCIGTSVRQGAACVTQIEIMPKPPVAHNPATPWPQWPAVLKTTSSHEEGCIRRWSLTSNRFLGKNGKVTGVEVEEVEWLPDPVNERSIMKPTGKKEIIEADMVLLAMGFLKPEQPVFAENVFIAGDAATGASLVVRAMASGRTAATEIEKYLNAKR